MVDSNPNRPDFAVITVALQYSVFPSLDYTRTAQFIIHDHHANYTNKYSNGASFDFGRRLEA